MDSTQPLILAVDTATPCSTVALTSGTREEGRIVASLSFTGRVSHSRRLFTAIDYLLREAEVDWSSIAAIAVSMGPGSFTGLRIGMATAKGLVAATGKTLLGVSTLDSLAAKCLSPRLICPVLDARKKEVYAAFYRCNGRGMVEPAGEMAVVAPEKLAANIDEPVVLIGDGAVAYRELFQRLLGDKVIFAPCQLHEPSAGSLGLLAGEKLLAGDHLDVATAVPIYIRSSDAELNLLQKKARMSDHSQKIPASP